MTTDWMTPRAAPSQRMPRTGSLGRALDRGSPLRRSDWVLTLAVGLLTALGVMLVWAATRPVAISNHLNPNGYLEKDLLNIVIGVALGVGVMLIDTRLLRAYAPVVYILSCIGLLAVLVIGSNINGAKAWISLGGGFTVQPTEFAKVAVVVGLAMFLGERRDGEHSPRGSDVLAVLGLCAVPLALILLEPDLGSVLVFVFTIFIVLAVSGVPARWLAGLLIAGVLVVGAAVHVGALSSYQVDRFKAFTNPTAATQSYGFNANEARIAIGSGGVLGKGLFHGPMTQHHFVPENETDFVFTVAGEELGLVGAASIVGLLGIILWRGLRIARRAGDVSDGFGALVAVGVVAWLTVQSFENIGMNVGIMPITGIPLPFVSYGGSSMFATMMAVGLLQSVHLRTQASTA